MDEQQFEILIQELKIMTEKLEEIRCCVIDVETEIQTIGPMRLPVLQTYEGS